MMPKKDSDAPGTANPAPEGPPDENSSATEGDTTLSRTDCFTVSRASLIYRHLFLLALTVLGALLLSLLFPIAVSGHDYLVGGLLAIWALALLRYWAFLLSMPHRICLEGDEILVLHSLFRTRKVKCAEIAAMRVSPYYQNYIKIVTSGKKAFPMLNHVDGLHDLITRIKHINPSLETKGC